ncbi:MAG: molybdopterin-dependent oxidoreductase, partial [Candidatus Aminicenantes bacterium]|nr:molybdopterin-dependent oxidoreductase [Candidatus Aminicenantes bacterium]
GSLTTEFFGPPLRQAAAGARGILVQLAAEFLGTSKDELAVKEGVVFDKKNPSKNVSYAALVQGKAIARRLDTKPPIKPISEHHISGKSTDRRDGREKVTGEAKYAGDIRLLGMLYARILRPSAHGAVLEDLDVSAARGVEGIRIVQDGDLIAVLHEHPDQAEKALRLIKARHKKPDTTPDNETIFDHLLKAPSEREVVAEAGDLEKGRTLSRKTFDLTYTNQYVAHAPMEPHTAVVDFRGEEATVWASTQTPFRAYEEAARALGIPSDKVRAVTPFVGGGFGGKTRNQQVTEAARLSKLTGRPVQVAWTRKEEFFYDTFRPAAVIKIESGLDETNRMVFWDYHNYFAGSRSSEIFYDIPHYKVFSYGGWGGGGGGSPHPFGVGAWRGPGSNTNVFAKESHVDIMAEAAGMDPLSFRLHNLKDQRMIRTLKAAADQFGKPFSKAPSGKGYGLAVTDYQGTYVAAAAEVEVDRSSGAIRVIRVVCAQDTGEVINPEGVRMQIEGCVNMGLGYCLTEEIRFRGGEVLDENFDTYEIPRFSWIPKIEPVLVDNPDLTPQGCGEPAITAMGALIANAVFDACGARLFTLPMTPARVKEALAASR